VFATCKNIEIPYWSVPWNTCVGLLLSFLSDYISMGTR